VATDDQENTSVILTAALQRDGRFEVSKATNGEDALSLCRQINPDVAILDIMMPRVHGLKVCQMLMKNPQTSWIRVIMLSALGRQYTKNEAYEYGADAYVTKPFSPQDLIRQVEAVLQDRDAAPLPTAKPGRSLRAMRSKRSIRSIVETGSGGSLRRVRVIPGASFAALSRQARGARTIGTIASSGDSGGTTTVWWDEIMPARQAA
jgi:two-component system alkaline phosphatase synthesis response regulator PhoP